MKRKRAFWAVSITSLILVIILLSLKAYYVVIAIVAGTLILGYRELWFLMRKRKLPPVDERIRENASKSIRNGFIFFAIASVGLMIFFSLNQNMNPAIVHVLGGLFLSVGLVYMLSYLFYEQAAPKLDEKRLKMLRTFLLVAGISLGAFIISVVLHNALSGLFGVEEPVFFSIAVFISPLAFAVGIIGSLAIFIKGLITKLT